MFLNLNLKKYLKAILWPPDVKNWVIGKDPSAGKDWRQEEKGTTEGEMVVWHHWLNGHEFEQTSGVGDGQGSLACCSPWGCKESVMSNSLRLHGLQHTKLPCSTSSPGACSGSCPLSQWCHTAILSSVMPSPPAFNLSQHQCLFSLVGSFHKLIHICGFIN